ncbi:MAG: nucleotidyltransferase family protein [Myxococcota bacterium]
MKFRALVLAGRRQADDPLARSAGAPHRALLDIAGRPMLERVLRTLSAHPRIGAVTVSIDQPELLERFPGLAEAASRGEFEVRASEDSPSRSVLAAFDAANEWPWLVTTADHALLDAAMLDAFLDAAESSRADLAVGLVSRTCIEKRFPTARRTYLPFRGESFSGANLFAFMDPGARQVAEFWQRAEHQRKQPWKLVREFGVVSLLLFLLRRLSLDAALERASRVVGARVAAVELPMAEAAVDVDKLDDLELVRAILRERAQASGRAAGGSGDPAGIGA